MIVTLSYKELMDGYAKDFSGLTKEKFDSLLDRVGDLCMSVPIDAPTLDVDSDGLYIDLRDTDCHGAMVEALKDAYEEIESEDEPEDEDDEEHDMPGLEQCGPVMDVDETGLIKPAE